MEEKTALYIYPGPHPTVAIAGFDFVKDEPIELPCSIGDDLVERKKVQAAPKKKEKKTPATAE